MKTLFNKITKLAIISIIPILVGSLNGCQNHESIKNGVYRYEGKNYFNYRDTSKNKNHITYTDSRKDGTLDLYENSENPYIVLLIVDDSSEVKGDKDIIYRNTDDAKNLQENFDRIKQKYNKK